MKVMIIVNKIGRVLSKNAPKILTGVGVAGVVTSGVMACKATPKACEEKEKFKERINDIHENPDKYENVKKETWKAYRDFGWGVTKIYGPSVALGAASLGSIIGSDHIMNKRNAAITAAYVSADKAFKSYRKNVIEDVGSGKDLEYLLGVKEERVDEKTIDENGNEVVNTTVKTTYAPNAYNDLYCRIYDNTCKGFTTDPVQNLAFLRQIQEYCNQTLKTTGFLCINEVFEALGFPKIPQGQFVGWIYDEKCPVGDNYVDFGLGEDNEFINRFLNCKRASVPLTFNHDGNIVERMTMQDINYQRKDL